MKQTMISTTHVVMGAITIAAGFFLALTLIVPFIYIVQHYFGDLPDILTAMSAGLGLGCACGMIPPGYGLILRRSWAGQTLQICVLFWAFATGFSFLDGGMFAFRPLHFIVLIEGIWPVIVLFWMKTREALIAEAAPENSENDAAATQSSTKQRPLPRLRYRQ